MPGRQYSLSMQDYKHPVSTMLGSPIANVADLRACAFNCLMVKSNWKKIQLWDKHLQNLDCLAYDYAPSTGACELHWDKANIVGNQYISAVGYNAYDRILWFDCHKIPKNIEGLGLWDENRLNIFYVKTTINSYIRIILGWSISSWP
jgi:hypothetical protein